MKRTVQHCAIAALVMLTSLSAALAQGTDVPQLSKEKTDEIKAQKSAYITTKLGLTAEQAQQFWPLYNEYDAQLDALRKEMREMHRSERSNGAELTEARALELITKNLAARQKELDVERTYSEKFRKSIGAVKTVELHRAERDFHRELLRRLKEKMGERPEGRSKGRR